MFFFFKQKTAYEMRISDWSSDVCSSDLDDRRQAPQARPQSAALHPQGRGHGRAVRADRRQGRDRRGAIGRAVPVAVHDVEEARFARTWRDRDPLGPPDQRRSSLFKHLRGARSEEHTSELQSLMRISYAVFCLKKKNKHG